MQVLRYKELGVYDGAGRKVSSYVIIKSNSTVFTGHLQITASQACRKRKTFVHNVDHFIKKKNKKQNKGRCGGVVL